MTNVDESTNSVYGTTDRNVGGVALGRRCLEAPQSVIKRNPPIKGKINFATWNVRTMNPHGSLEQIVKEADRLRIDILGIAETRWMNNGRVKTTEGWEMYYSGGAERYAGVGFLIRPEVKESVTEVRPVSERIMYMRVNAKPRPFNIIQVRKRR